MSFQTAQILTLWIFRSIFLNNRYHNIEVIPGRLLTVRVGYYTLKRRKVNTVFGLCIGLKKLQNVSSFYLRNVLGRVLVNFKILFYNPLLFRILSSNFRFVKISKAKFSFLLYLPFLFRVNKCIYAIVKGRRS